MYERIWWMHEYDNIVKDMTTIHDRYPSSRVVVAVFFHSPISSFSLSMHSFPSEQAPLYNCSLALYYLLVIKYSWTNTKLKKIERQVHAILIAFAIGTSVLGLPLTMYNQVTSVCWVIGSPSECGNSNSTPSDIPCDRGDWAWLFGILLFYGPLWLCVLLTIIAMAMIYLQIRNTFQKSEHYQFDSTASQRSKCGMENSRLPEPTVASLAMATSNRMSRFSIWSLTKRTESDSELQVAVSQAEQEDTITDQATAINPETSSPEDKDPTVDLRDDQIDLGIRQQPHPHRPTNERKGHPQIGFLSDCKIRTDLGTTDHTSRRVRTAKRTRTKNQRKQTLFAAQAILYSVSFFITWMPSTIWSVSHWFGATGVGFDLAAVICEPLQGFWNMLIFIRSRPRSQAKLARVFGKCFGLCLNMLPKLADEDALATNSDGFDSSVGSRPAKSGSRQSAHLDSHLSCDGLKSEASLPIFASEASVMCNSDPIGHDTT